MVHFQGLKLKRKTGLRKKLKLILLLIYFVAGRLVLGTEIVFGTYFVYCDIIHIKCRRPYRLAEREMAATDTQEL